MKPEPRATTRYRSSRWTRSRGWPPENGDEQRARLLLEEADALAPSVAHLIDEVDRLDKAVTQSQLAVHDS